MLSDLYLIPYLYTPPSSLLPTSLPHSYPTHISSASYFECASLDYLDIDGSRVLINLSSFHIIPNNSY